MVQTINDILTGVVRMENIPYFSHEGDMARMERTQRRLWIACLVVLGILVASNVAWVVYVLI